MVGKHSRAKYQLARCHRPCFLIAECEDRVLLGLTHEESPLARVSVTLPVLTYYLPFSVVSNEVPEHPCVSPVSNHVYERRLIEKYIAENGTDPVNNQPLSEEQLIDIKGAHPAPQPKSRASSAQPSRVGGGAGLVKKMVAVNE